MTDQALDDISERLRTKITRQDDSSYLYPIFTIFSVGDILRFWSFKGGVNLLLRDHLPFPLYVNLDRYIEIKEPNNHH